ncbi:MAG TPA: hypothetical protein VM283_01325 [Armatimonadota bacterium]|nr:hypothetical protein [Armatimonadota bacterium]
MEGGLFVAGIAAIVLIVAQLFPFMQAGRWLIALGIGVPAVALVFWVELACWRQKWGGHRHSR